MSDRFIVDEDYNWVDTLTNECFDEEYLFDIANELYNENVKLRNKVNKLKKDNKKDYKDIL